MVHEVDRVPDKIINKEGKRIAQDQEGDISLLEEDFLILKQIKFSAKHHVAKGADQGKEHGQEHKLEDLLFQLFLEEVHPDDHYAHEVGQHKSQEDKYADPFKEYTLILGAGDLIQRPVEKQVYQDERAPSG
jgi:hypothetical protein